MDFIGLMGRVSANDPGDLSSVLGCVIPKSLKMVLDASLLNTQHKVVAKIMKTERGGLPFKRPRMCIIQRLAVKRRNLRWLPRLFITIWSCKVVQIVTACMQMRWLLWGWREVTIWESVEIIAARWIRLLSLVWRVRKRERSFAQTPIQPHNTEKRVYSLTE